MDNINKTRVLVAETDKGIINEVSLILNRRKYEFSIHSGWKETEESLKQALYPLAIIGETGDADSPFEVMEKIVRTSPMTSIILISDLPEEEALERAEGYGILGSVNRSVPEEGLIKLLDNFEAIIKATPMS